MDNFCHYAKFFYVNISKNIYRQLINILEIFTEADFVSKILFCFFIYTKIEFLISTTKTYIKDWNERTNNTVKTYNSIECAICMDFKREPVRLNCGHIFCYDCLLMLIKNHNTYILKCPVCRSKIKKFSSYSDEAADSKKIAKLNKMINYSALYQPYSNQFFIGICSFVLFLIMQKIVIDNCTIEE